ncbi:hypothetical protein LNP04_15340 [Chryseobacterium sp. C-71]|uniref:hypothetical protein n=1 Tax=Chryseobacterium sp. C-71 TaxID=2893882 RepID=UPI001E5B7D6B|nr:hypothetical protein [Chryseobacterium sp. C-71]UFH31330.1 hypothetical protein LNP04_15340 [Chryseobacterium sp. C-71]
MKKIFLYILAGSLCFSACKKDDEVETFVEPENIEVRNSLDEQAIQKFMDNNYLDTQGNIKAFTADAADDNFKKLSELSPQKLPSGVIYIKRDGAQPTPGKAIGDNSLIKTMMRGSYYRATDIDGNVALTSGGTLINTIDLEASPVTDPTFYYAKKSMITDARPRSYFEIEGLKEALKYFNGFENLPNETLPNLQGVIIIPSKAAFARDANYYNLQNATFVFNFQIYHTETRPANQE